MLYIHYIHYKTWPIKNRGQRKNRRSGENRSPVFTKLSKQSVKIKYFNKRRSGTGMRKPTGS